jgi:hypothetical protein
VSRQKYADGDCRRAGPGYRSLQRSTQRRLEMREALNEEAKKAGFRSLAALIFAQAKQGNASPRHYWRTAQYKGHTRAREAKRLAERQVADG